MWVKGKIETYHCLLADLASLFLLLESLTHLTLTNNPGLNTVGGILRVGLVLEQIYMEKKMASVSRPKESEIKRKG